MIKVLNLKLVILKEYPNISNNYPIKILFRGHVISDLKGEEIVATCYQKELQKTELKK